MTDQPLLWQQPAWQEQAHAWICAELERRRIALTGAITQPHVRPWSTVLRVPTSEGAVYFKASAPSLAHEAGLTAALAQWLGMLCRALTWYHVVSALEGDAGEPLRTRVRAERDLTGMLAVLPLYAELQIDMANRQGDLLRLGAFDRRLQRLPALYAQLLNDTEALMIDQSDGLPRAVYAQAQARAPRLPAFCQELTAYGLPETLHHDDFHDANIFARGGRISFTDWGESCVAHPFFSMVVARRSAAYSLGLADVAPELSRLRDAYLEPWEQFAPRERLLTAMRLAQWLGMLCRALTWYHVVSALEGDARAAYAEAVRGWLAEFLDAAESMMTSGDSI